MIREAFGEIIILAIGIALGCLGGFVWGAAKTSTDMAKAAIEHGCAEMAPDTTHKIFQWKEPQP